MIRPSLFYWCFLSLSTASVFAALPPEAIAILEQFPNRSLSPELVIQKAMGVSDSFRSLRANQLTAEALEKAGNAITEPKAFAKTGFYNSRYEPQNPFSPNYTDAKNYGVGISTLLPTGTALSFELTHSTNELRFNTIPNLKYAESRATLGLEQSLWQNAFGSGTRAGKEALRLNAEANRQAFDEAKEGWFLNMLEVYYGAWLAQTQHLAAKQNLTRRERLLKIVQIKLRRGTSERPDLLQVQSATSGSQVQLASTAQNLADQWRALCTILKFPDAVQRLDPADIPMDLDQPVEQAIKACGTPNTPAGAPQSSASTRRASLSEQAAALAAEKARSEDRPDLKLSLGLGTNSVDANSSGTLSDFVAARHPLLSANLTLTVPLGSNDGEAKVAQAQADELRAGAAASVEKDLLNVRWKNGCSDLHRLVETQNLLTSAFKMQTEREKLEEQRFEIGRSGTLQVIQAGDDVTETQLSLRRTEVALRLAAWKVLRFRGTILEALQTLSAKTKS